MKVLVVDDEYEKVQNIANVLRREAELGEIEIVHETTAQAARSALRKDKFDLLVIDLNLPDAIGASASVDGGLSFFSMICMDLHTHLPSHVVFLTAREDLLQAASSQVTALGATLYQFSSTSLQWQSALVGRAKYAFTCMKRARALERKVDIAVVTALKVPELEAVLALPYRWKPVRFPGDPTPYHFGTVDRGAGSGHLSIVCAAAARKGMASAGALAARVTTLFSPKYLVMTGICAGIAGKTELGDVVIADPSWDCGSGKQTEHSDGSSVFRVAPYQRPLEPNVAQIASELASDLALMQSIRAAWTGKVPQERLSAYVGPMASGASVVAVADLAKEITAQHKDLRAIEMEAYAVMAATEYFSSPAPVAIVVKAVCDFADSRKSDDWQAYAAYTSAAFADKLFKHAALLP